MLIENNLDRVEGGEEDVHIPQNNLYAKQEVMKKMRKNSANVYTCKRKKWAKFNFYQLPGPNSWMGSIVLYVVYALWLIWSSSSIGWVKWLYVEASSSRIGSIIK